MKNRPSHASLLFSSTAVTNARLNGETTISPASRKISDAHSERANVHSTNPSAVSGLSLILMFSRRTLCSACAWRTKQTSPSGNSCEACIGFSCASLSRSTPATSDASCCSSSSAPLGGSSSGKLPSSCCGSSEMSGGSCAATSSCACTFSLATSCVSISLVTSCVSILLVTSCVSSASVFQTICVECSCACRGGTMALMAKNLWLDVCSLSFCLWHRVQRLTAGQIAHWKR
mmetsp:Transcript_130385/g.260104  ORF Transcript_130385/g.260104 Transcript_130385/m.260104 type:complete len:232 (-) Transcript_130385:734-1429(-)